MQTREEFYSIGNRIDLRGQMFYITYPYTSLRQDAMLLGADTAVATQEYMAEQAAQLATTKRLSSFSQAPMQVKQRGQEVLSQGQQQFSYALNAVPERMTGTVVVMQG